MKTRLLCCAVSILLCAGCAHKPITIYEPVPVPVPEELLRACKPALSALESNSDLEQFAAESYLCNLQHEADKEAIRGLE